MKTHPHTSFLTFTTFFHIRFFVAKLIDNFQNSELVTNKTRVSWALLLIAAYFAFVLFASPLASGFSPDTAGYLELSPYRQPLYGLWANGIYLISGSWRIVEALQVAAFVAFTAWVIIELVLISNLGMLSALLFVLMMLAFARLGMLNIVGSLISESLFYPMIMLMAAMFLAWARTRKRSLLIGLAIISVAMTQLRTAALLVAAVPIFVAICVLAQGRMRSAKAQSAVLVLTTIAIGFMFMPPLLGKSVMQISTTADTLGFQILPRVSLLPVPPALDQRSPEWNTMSSSWRAAAEKLDGVALTQFDAQLQEAIRFDLGPKILLPAILNRSPKDIGEEWLKGTYFDDAKRLAIRWILAEWPTYVRMSWSHFWGLLTMANFMDNPDRERVWKALNSVSSLTWHEAPFRTDYPLNCIYEQLSWSTNAFYLLVRYLSIAILVIGAISAATALMKMRANHEVSPGTVAIALAVGWSIAHSVPAALLMFPEYRYTYANMLMMLSGGAAWLAYAGTNRRLSSPQIHGVGAPNSG